MSRSLWSSQHVFFKGSTLSIYPELASKVLYRRGIVPGRGAGNRAEAEVKQAHCYAAWADSAWS